LSKDGTISCSSCHTLPGSGANTTAYSYGVDAKEGNINSPTVLNSVYNFSQFWNGRAKDLKSQAIGPIINPVEMANSMKNIKQSLTNSSHQKEFLAIYPDGVSEDNILDVLAEFQKALITPNSRFDKYLGGDENAINEQEKRGYKEFKDIGCVSCHNGVNVGGNMYQKMGVVLPYEQDKPLNGRYDVTNRERDRDVYKVPTLRNIELTAPYFHDGKATNLKEAIDSMQELQLGITTDKKRTADIEAFLKTLTGEMPEILKEVK